MKIIFSEHALFEMKRRGIEQELVKKAIINPQQKFPAKNGRTAVQIKYYDIAQGHDMLLRVMGEETAAFFEVVTVYKTSKIKKYWRVSQ